MCVCSLKANFCRRRWRRFSFEATCPRGLYCLCLKQKVSCWQFSLCTAPERKIDSSFFLHSHLPTFKIFFGDYKGFFFKSQGFFFVWNGGSIRSRCDRKKSSPPLYFCLNWGSIILQFADARLSSIRDGSSRRTTTTAATRNARTTRTPRRTSGRSWRPATLPWGRNGWHDVARRRRTGHRGFLRLQLHLQHGQSRLWSSFWSASSRWHVAIATTRTNHISVTRFFPFRLLITI